MSINRLKEDLIETSQYGRESIRKASSYKDLDPGKGVTRPTGSEGNKQIRDYAVRCMDELGLEITIDKIGNIFGRKNGSVKDQKSIMCGSHLDSVINGGQFDGALGVFAAIEAVRRIKRENFNHERPIEVVIFTGEEGSAFGLTLLGSTALVGKLSLEDALNMKDNSGITLFESLEKIGYLGSKKREINDVEYFLEMHIEQGPVLYNKKVPIGVVENISGIAWVFATILGEGNHAGTTPMSMRKDSLLAASEIIQFVNERTMEIIEEKKSSTVGTVGKMNVYPNGTNIIPARVDLGIDIRDVKYENMELLQNNVIKKIKELEEKHHVSTEVKLPPIHLPSPLDQEVIKTISESSNNLGINSIRMNSGAGHDSQNMAEVVKTGMIFVPSVKGISHSPMEWTEWEDIEKGEQVLVETIKTLASIKKYS